MPLQGAERDAGIAELPKAVQTADRQLLSSAIHSNPMMPILRTEGSLEQARFIKLAHEGATLPQLGKEFDISLNSAWYIRTELMDAGKIKGAAKRQGAPKVKGAAKILRTEGSTEQARFIKLAQDGATMPKLAMEFDISTTSAHNIRAELSNAGKLKRTFKQGQSQGGDTKLKVSSSVAAAEPAATPAGQRKRSAPVRVDV